MALITNIKFRRLKHLLLVTICLILTTIWLLNKSDNDLEFSEDKSRFFRHGNPRMVYKRGNFEPNYFERQEGLEVLGKPLLVSQYLQNDVAVSDHIALNRSIPDTRSPECKFWDYPTQLPSVSVIIVFHNEISSVLLRTLHSVINRSPDYMLEEVVLIDDFSDAANLQQDLEEAIKVYNHKVRLIRNFQREGLIRSKSKGAEYAWGEVVIFLDSHCEVNTNWLPPLLTPISLDVRTMTIPTIDEIELKTFEYKSVYKLNQLRRGIFEWGLLYREVEVLRKELRSRKYISQPYPSPTHAGTLFAINRNYFLQIGAHDPGLLGWGGENFELSFKIWQCGGSIQRIPCSRIGCVNRRHNFDTLILLRNYKRIVETWFDEEYKQFFYTREPLAKYINIGNIADQLALKRQLNCKGFQWYMKYVAHDVLDLYPKLPGNILSGELRLHQTNICVNARGNVPPLQMSASFCHGLRYDQMVRLNERGQLGMGDRCIVSNSNSVLLTVCKLGKVDGPWHYDQTTRMIVHRFYNKCITLDSATNDLVLMSCNIQRAYQRWQFRRLRPSI